MCQILSYGAIGSSKEEMESALYKSGSDFGLVDEEINEYES
ncbi:MAG: hypothetical protein QXU18_14100 [Thermoplasmatales archaeon]